MSDYIKREDAIKRIKSIREENSTIEEAEGLTIAEDVLADMPSADVIENVRVSPITTATPGKPIEFVAVVRCKNCKWWTKQEDSIQGRCELSHSYPTGAWYCANGEREDDEHK